MKQAFFVTSPNPGQPLDKNSSCQIRAAPPGLAPERLQTLLPLARFAPPAGDEAHPFSPVRLGLVRTAETGRCVLHSQIARPAPPGSAPSFELPLTGETTPAEPPRLGLTHVL